MDAVLNCLPVEHDLRLVFVAMAVCAVASVAAFGFQSMSLEARTGIRWGWLGLTGAVAGSGVWSTHFIGMLAYEPSLHIRFDYGMTAESLLLAMLGLGVSFALPVVDRRNRGAVAGGLAAGISIAAMHFIGIASLRTQAAVSMAPTLVVASLAIGIGAAIAAFLVRRLIPGRAGWLGASALLLLGILGLHFTAMAAVSLTPDPRLVDPGPGFGRTALTVAASALATLILSAAYAILYVEKLSQRTTLASLQRALNIVPAALAFLDRHDTVVAANEAFVKLFAEFGVTVRRGARRQALLDGIAAAGWFGDPATPDPRLADVRDWQASGLEFPLTGGRWFRYEAFHTEDGSGVVVLSDITGQRASARAMAAARDAAEAANRAKSDFLANMSHEIRTPLNGVLNVATLLEQTELSPKQHDLVEVIQESGGLLNSLLSDLLDLARIEAGAVELRPEITDVADLVETVRDLFAAGAGQKGLSLRTRIEPGAGWVSCDPVRLRQVLGNLVGNAVKFTDVGQVTIAVERGGDQLTFRVSDTGRGFNDALKTTLFKRFQQADNTSTRRHGGAGLGLAICKEYVALMGGELDCASRTGEGSMFMFSLNLPRVAAPDAELAADVITPSSGFRVLIVDDNAINRQVLGLILDTVAIEHSDAENGQAGLEAAMSGAFDAVLMDIQMPVMDGFEFHAPDPRLGSRDRPPEDADLHRLRELPAGPCRCGRGGRRRRSSGQAGVDLPAAERAQHGVARRAHRRLSRGGRIKVSFTTVVDGPFTMSGQDSVCCFRRVEPWGFRSTRFCGAIAWRS